MVNNKTQIQTPSSIDSRTSIKTWDFFHFLPKTASYSVLWHADHVLGTCEANREPSYCSRHVCLFRRGGCDSHASRLLESSERPN